MCGGEAGRGGGGGGSGTSFFIVFVFTSEMSVHENIYSSAIDGEGGVSQGRKKNQKKNMDMCSFSSYSCGGIWLKTRLL